MWGNLAVFRRALLIPKADSSVQTCIFVGVWVAEFQIQIQMNASEELDVKEETPIVPPSVHPLHVADPRAQGAVEVPEAPAGRDRQGPVAVCPVDACLSRRASRQEGCVIGVLAQEVSSSVLVAIFDQISGVK